MTRNAQEGNNSTINTYNKTFVNEAIADYITCLISREASLVARKEVLSGKAKFGITGDGKELPQVAMARAFKKGDWRAGYYRDQTFMFALGILSLEDFFAQLYADNENDPSSGGRQMNSHFATPTIDKHTGIWTNHKENYNISSDISCTGGQMARALGLALASKKYRQLKNLSQTSDFSNKGNEVAFCTIGDASTSEGIFWESINAATVMQVPMAISVWDDGYGISVPIALQTTKSSISAALDGFKLNEAGEGMNIHTCKGWDYPALRTLYHDAIENTRNTHIPVLLHIQELTQPQGHSTSGSHERYKKKERLEWEKTHDCIYVMRNWLIQSDIATEQELVEMEANTKQKVKEAKAKAWANYTNPIKSATAELNHLFEQLDKSHPDHSGMIRVFKKEISSLISPVYADLIKITRRTLQTLRTQKSNAIDDLTNWLDDKNKKGATYYYAHLHSETPNSALNVAVVAPIFSETSATKNGYELLNHYFDHVFNHYPNTFAFGEDVGHIGDVNQGMSGLQLKYGTDRIFDTGIREWTIAGQAIGMSMRGLRPIAEIQYLDYLLYALPAFSDDLATLRYRSNGQQAAPAIIRTRGHRLEGIWHSGSPMGMMIHSLRGIYLCVPRNMTQAAGMYNTLLKSDDPGIVIECLNGYRLKERMPDNIETFTVPLGVPEVLQSGTDITLVTYGSCVRIAQEALETLNQQGISVELIDIQTLMPFDLEHLIVSSVKKTSRLIVLDEDVPGGASAYILQEILEKQNAYRYLDAAPVTIAAAPNRPAYGSDGDYFCKPSAEDIIDAVYKIMINN
jgi:pyruvate/2-oxoglutarate/acetoin dehydrogenase E1 component/TPP-dependent pyruvate/acetoin dehydrogenase alpha subunit